MLEHGQTPTIDPAFDPDGQAGMYLQAMADGHVFNVRKDPSEHLTGKETVEDVLKTAIGLEKDSIVFYLGIKEMVPKKMGKENIDNIIKEEMIHISILSKELVSVD